MNAPQEAYPLIVQGLEINVMSDGYVVYDSKRDRIHYLNAVSALILELCVGSYSIAQIADVVKDTFQTELSPLELTRSCVAQLAAEGLVEI